MRSHSRVPVAVNLRKLLLRHAISSPVVQAMGLVVVARGAGPVAKTSIPRELKAHFLFPGRSRGSCPVRLVHYRNDTTSTSNRLVPGNRFNFESLKSSRNVALGYLVGGEFLGEVAEHVLRQPRWHLLRHVTTAMGAGSTCAGKHQRRAYRKEYQNTGARPKRASVRDVR